MADPTRLNRRYSVIRRLGDGAGGAVYLVHDEHGNGRELAAKVVPGADPATRALLLGEFRRLASLSHPCLVTVFDLETVVAPVDGFAVGTLFFTAQYIPGVDLATAVPAAHDRLETLLAVAEDVAAALEHSHVAGLLHCDVKPSNVLVQSRGHGARATLLDLGLSAARGIRGEPRGTLAYMSPEALAGAPTARSDLYGLGATLFQAATGRAPFEPAESSSDPSSDSAALIRAICDGAAPVNRALGPAAAALPAGVADLIDRLLAVDPVDRPSSAAVVLDELAQLRDGLGLERAEAAPSRAGRVTVLPPALIGRGDELAMLERALAPAGPRLIRLHGPPGVGRHALLRQAIRARQLEAAAGRALPVQVVWGDPDRLAAALGAQTADAPGDAAHAVARYVDRVLALAATAAGSSQLILVVETED
ncbi:MAG TPA: serine/threonine-protein kinase, partial [Kofleriaceae bacterium]|nr:serine/threonine-protein kinase [Kofleriaceae bacterium]